MGQGGALRPTRSDLYRCSDWTYCQVPLNTGQLEHWEPSVKVIGKYPSPPHWALAGFLLIMEISGPLGIKKRGVYTIACI